MVIMCICPPHVCRVHPELGPIHLLVCLKCLTVMPQDHDIGAQAVHALLTAVILLGVKHDRVSDAVPVFPDAAGIAREQNIALTGFNQQVGNPKPLGER